MMGVLLEAHDLQVVLDRLREGGRKVLAPVRRSDAGVVGVEPVESLEELPVGWRDEQSPGSYRLVRTEEETLFGTTAPTPGWKAALYPPRTLLIRARRDREKGFAPEESPRHVAPLAFFGIRSCDVAAIDRLDRVFMADGATDPAYAARREALVLVAVTCTEPGGTCFCASTGCGPVPGDDVDLRLTELVDHPEGCRVLAEAVSEIGVTLTAGLGRSASDEDLAEAKALGERSAVRMGRTLDTEAVTRAGSAPEHPRWEEVASRCLACANCTMVCPTCFCSTTEDLTDLSGDVMERWRRWDSCFTLDFSWVHGGHVRPSVGARYRQWLLHKLVTWREQFDTGGCVGCGRCITWCPAGIDLTEEIAAVGAAP